MAGNETLYLCSLNVSAFLSSRIAIMEIMEEKKPKVFMAQEISKSPDTLKTIKGYNLWFRERTNQRGGGVATWISSNEEACMVPNISFFEQGHFESIAVQLTDKKRLLVNYYRPPSGCLDIFFEKLTEQFHYAAKNKLKIIASGDANINWRKKSPAKTRLETLLASYHCSQLVTETTRPRSNTIIDLLFTNNTNHCHRAVTECANTSDHQMIALWQKRLKDTKKTPQRNETTEYTTFYVFNKETIEKCQLDLDREDWYQWEKKHDCLENMLHSLTTMISTSVKHNCKKTKILNEKRKPWYTSELKHLKEKCIRLQKKMVKHFTTEGEKTYKESRALYRKMCRQNKCKYYENKFEEVKNDSKKTWRLINEVAGRSKSRSVMKQATRNGKTFRGHEVADQFNSYFKEIPLKLKSNLPRNTGNFKKYLEKVPKVKHALRLQSLERDEVFLALRSMKPKKGPDGVGIPPIILNKLRLQLVHPLTVFFNRCIQAAQWPDDMKISRVIPIPKKQGAIDVTDFRPISLVNSISKVFERLVYNKILHHLEINNVLSKNQFGFRRGHTTSHAISKLVSEININKFKGRKVALTLLDISKAFDTIDCDVMLAKLEHYGLDASYRQLIASYLKDRKQFVDVGGFKSTPTVLQPIGVPQGSILGPLLFLVYINDLNFLFKNDECRPIIITFADDTAIILANKTEVGLCSGLTSSLKLVMDWFTTNKLTVNNNKTKLLLFGKHSGRHNITMKGQILLPVKKAKYLGMIIDNKLSLQEHVNSLLSKLKSGAFLLRCCRQFLSKQARLFVYNATVNCHIHYCLPIWGNLVKSGALKKVAVVQKRGIRHIAKVGPLSHTGELFKKLSLLKVEDMIQKSNIQICERFLSGTLPPTIAELLTSKRMERLRQNPKILAKKGDGLFHSVVSAFNQLPKALRISATTLASTSSVSETVAMGKLSQYRNCDGGSCRLCVFKNQNR